MKINEQANMLTFGSKDNESFVVNLQRFSFASELKNNNHVGTIELVFTIDDLRKIKDSFLKPNEFFIDSNIIGESKNDVYRLTFTTDENSNTRINFGLSIDDIASEIHIIVDCSNIDLWEQTKYHL